MQNSKYQNTLQNKKTSTIVISDIISLKIYFQSKQSKYSMRHAQHKPTPGGSEVKLSPTVRGGKKKPHTFYSIPLIHTSHCIPPAKQFLELPEPLYISLMHIIIQSKCMNKFNISLTFLTFLVRKLTFIVHL